MERLILVLEIEPISQEVFREWPLHCTLVHWFAYQGDMSRLISELGAICAEHKPVCLVGRSEALFGERQNVRVNLVDPSELQALHNESVERLQKLGASFNSEQFLRSGYRPHVTVHGGRRLAEGSEHQSSAVYLVRSVNEHPKERQLVKRLVLGH